MEWELDVSAKQIAILNGTTFIVSAIFTIFTSPIMNKFEARSIMITCAVSFSFGTALFISSKNYAINAIGRGLIGAA